MKRLSRLRSGVTWGLVATAMTTVCQLGLTAVLARLLSPADFGIVAIAGLSLKFLSHFSQLGIGTALVQKKAIDSEDIATALSISMGLGLICVGLSLAGAPLAELFFRIEGLAWTVAAISLGFLINGFAVIATSLLRREARFRALALTDVSSYVIGYGCVGIPLAWMGARAWALVGATLTQSLTAAIFVFIARPHSLALRHGKTRRAHFLGFGTRYSLISFLEFLTTNIDSLVIGRAFGAAEVGIYTRAALLSNLPVMQPVGIFTRTLFPVLSGDASTQSQSHGAQLSLLVVATYSFAVAGGLFVAAPDIVFVLLGQQWTEAVPIMRILAISVAAIYVSQVGGVMCDVMGLLNIKLRLQSAALLTLAVAIFYFMPRGVMGIALAVALTEWLRLPVYVWVLCRRFAWSRGDVLRVMWAAVAAAGCSIAAVLAASWAAPADAHAALRLLAQTTAGVTGLAAGLFMLRRVHARISSVGALARLRPTIGVWLGPIPTRDGPH